MSQKVSSGKARKPLCKRESLQKSPSRLSERPFSKAAQEGEVLSGHNHEDRQFEVDGSIAAAHQKELVVSSRNKRPGRVSRPEEEKLGTFKVLEGLVRKVEKSLLNAFEATCDKMEQTGTGSNGSERRGGVSARLKFLYKHERKVVFYLKKTVQGGTDSKLDKSPESVKQELQENEVSIGSPKKRLRLQVDEGPEDEGRTKIREMVVQKISRTWDREKEQLEYANLVSQQMIVVMNKVKEGFIVLFDDIVKTLNTAVNSVFRRFPNICYSSFFAELQQSIRERMPQFYERRWREISQLGAGLKNLSIQTENYPRDVLQPRLYRDLTSYKSVFEGQGDPALSEAYSIDRLMASDLKGDCSANCCCGNSQTISEYTNFAGTTASWDCACEDKKFNIECGADCRCGPDCKNRLLQQKKELQLGRDLSLQTCWGIDAYTRKNLTALLPSCVQYPTETASQLIEEVVVELNRFEREGWNIAKPLESLVARYRSEQRGLIQRRRQSKRGENRSPTEEHELSAALCSIQTKKRAFKVLLKHSKTAAVRPLLRVFCKGLGVVCSAPEGIPANSLVVEYLGEVYPTWYWYVKQDAIKSFLLQIQKNKSSKFAQYRNNYNMDFYNIMLEKSPREPEGRQIVVVDPILRGNFASRLSHSCAPNCCTLPVIVDQRYSIALFASKVIRPGEELTFDYCSFTENEKEYQSSICLCGHALCNGFYLSYTKKHVSVFDEAAKNLLLDNASVSFLEMNALLLRSTVTAFTQKEREWLRSHSVGENLLQETPNWLRAWTYLIMRAIVEERENLYAKLLNSPIDPYCQNMLSLEQRSFRFEIENLFFQRTNNMIITIDKVRHFLSRQEPSQALQPPIRFLASEEAIPHFADIILCVSEEVFAESLPSLASDLSELVRLLKSLVVDVSTERARPDDVSTRRRSVQELRATSQSPADALEAMIQVACRLKLPGLESQLPPLEPWVQRLVTSSNQKMFDGLLLVKLILLWIAEALRLKGSIASCQPMADVLYFNALTVHSFTSEVYNSFEIPIKIRECDLTNPRKCFEFNSASKEAQLNQLERPIETINKFAHQKDLFRFPLGTADLLVQTDHRKTRSLTICSILIRVDVEL